MKVKPLRNRVGQFSYLFKSYWPQRAVRETTNGPKRDRKGHRIAEPFHSQVLLWLDLQKLDDLIFMNDCWSWRRGGPEAMKRLYLAVAG